MCKILHILVLGRKQQLLYLSVGVQTWSLKKIVHLSKQMRKFEKHDKGLFACGMYLDFKKPFGIVNNNIYHNKTETTYALKGNTNYWLNSFLTDRKQYKNLKGNNSNSQKIADGIPYGTLYWHPCYSLSSSMI